MGSTPPTPPIETALTLRIHHFCRYARAREGSFKRYSD
jgi:hypothetical protein